MVRIADGELDAGYAVPVCDEPCKEVNQPMQALALLLQAVNEEDMVEGVGRGNDDGEDEEKEKRVDGPQGCHQSAPNGKRQTIDKCQDTEEGVEDEDAREVPDRTEM